MTGPRSARSAALLVGSTPSVVVNVQSAGQILSRLLAKRRCSGCACFSRGVLEQRRNSSWIGLHLGFEPLAVLVLAVGAPGGEHSVGQCEAGLAEGLLFGQPFAVAAEVALQM